jgi:ketosteroid isomerase-like protein
MKTARSAWMWCGKPASSNGITVRPDVHWHDTSSANSRLAPFGSCYLHDRGVDMRQVAVNFMKSFGAWLVLAAALLAIASPAGAQKKPKNAPTTDSAEDLKSSFHPPDGQAVDQAIGEALGYWQIGDVDSLHKYYSDDIVLVSGAWEPPVVGWANFLKAYQAQRAQVTGARMDRSNTLIKVNGNSAWATYQFIYAAQMDGKVVQFRGHTTLVLAKPADRWVITLNHSSIVDSSVPEPATSSLDSGQPGIR